MRIKVEARQGLRALQLKLRLPLPIRLICQSQFLDSLVIVTLQLILGHKCQRRCPSAQWLHMSEHFPSERRWHLLVYALTRIGQIDLVRSRFVRGELLLYR